MIKLVIFDLDGTLLDTIDDLATSANHALGLHGFPAHELAAYRYFVGNGIRELLRRALPEGSRDEVTVEKLRKDFVAHYDAHNVNLTRPYAGIPELLEELRSRETVMAVASNKYQLATEKLVRHYFGDLFSAVFGQREGIDPKPDPTIVHDILERTGVAKEHTLYIGDSSVDVQTAAASGLTSVGVTWGFRPREELERYGANHLVDRAEEILSVIAKIESGG